MKARLIRLALASMVLSGCQRAASVTGASAAAGEVAIRDGVAWGLASSRSSTIGFRVTAATADTLVAVESPDGTATLHTMMDGRMADLLALPVAGGATVVLGGGGPHIMLTETTHGFAPGDSVRIVLQWARSGRLAFSVPLRNYSDASGLLEGR
jgi:copper(I)-binding protein